MAEVKRTAVRYEGREGRVTFPDIGALIGYFAAWRLERDGDTFTLHATFAYINENLWSKHIAGELQYERAIMLQMGRERRIALEQTDGAATTLEGHELTMEGITIQEI